MNNPKILALDTSSTSASAALLEGGFVLAEAAVTRASIKTGKTHSETLMPMVRNLFDLTGLVPKNLDYIAVTQGPGSFTGLRIAAAAAKGFALALGIPIIPVPTLDAIAFAASEFAPETWLIPTMDARRGQVYTALYKQGKPGDMPVRHSDYTAATLEEFLLLHKEIIDGGKIIYLNENAKASAVGRLASKMTEKAVADFELIYLRKPQAEREREQREANSN